MVVENKVIEIFYADDNKSDLVLFEQALKEIDIPTYLITVRSGKEAIELLNCYNFIPDLIFLDWKRHITNGRECLKHIRTIKRLDHTPVIIFSGNEYDKNINIAYENKATLYVKTPSESKKLTKVLTKILAIDWNKYLPQPKEQKFVLH